MRVESVKAMSIGGGVFMGMLLWINLPTVILGKSQPLDPPALSVEDEPLSREVKLATSFSSVVKLVAPSVVYVTSERDGRAEMEPPTDPLLERSPLFRFFDQRGTRPNPPRPVIGSGVIISEEGYILTNHHVISEADDVLVTLEDQTTQFPAKVIGADPHTDVAVLKIQSEKPLPAVTLSNSDTLEIGDVVLALGNPFGVGQTVTMGIVSATGRSGFGMVNVGDFIQTDASINPGNSGGARVDAEGRLVGINTLIISRTGGNQGIGFAVPINMARNVMDQIVEYGDVQRGLLGISMQRMDEALSNQFGIEVGQGVLVSEVLADGPADQAGLRAGDVILEFDRRPVTEMRELKLMVAETRPETEVAFLILRDGDELTKQVILGRLPEEGYAALSPSLIPEKGGMEHDALDGVTVSDLTSDSRAEFQIPRKVRGALVTRVERESPSDVAGLSRGDVIVAIERQPIESAEDAVALSERISKRSVLLRLWSPGVGSRFVVVDAGKDRRR